MTVSANVYWRTADLRAAVRDCCRREVRAGRYPAVKAIAAELGASRPRVSRIRRELIEAGEVRCVVKCRDDDDLRRSVEADCLAMMAAGEYPSVEALAGSTGACHARVSRLRRELIEERVINLAIRKGPSGRRKTG